MYKVLKIFSDLQDRNHIYNVGDEYPRKGLKPTKARIAELAGYENKHGVPLIAEEAEPEQDGEQEDKQDGEQEGEK